MEILAILSGLGSLCQLVLMDGVVCCDLMDHPAAADLLHGGAELALRGVRRRLLIGGNPFQRGQTTSEGSNGNCPEKTVRQT